LSGAEKKLYDCINETPKRLDSLAEQSGTEIAELFNILLSLELKSLIKQVAGQQYIRV
jgi:predicted Rossmann fold nucleotide-binding protein DprA/Smf involved in DNA uptake